MKECDKAMVLVQGLECWSVQNVAHLDTLGWTFGDYPCLDFAPKGETKMSRPCHFTCEFRRPTVADRIDQGKEIFEQLNNENCC
jgi:hypothetical protein